MESKEEDLVIWIEEKHKNAFLQRILNQVSIVFRTHPQFNIQITKLQAYQLFYWYGIALVAEFSPETRFMCDRTQKHICCVHDVVMALSTQFNAMNQLS